MDDNGAIAKNVPPYLGFQTLQNFLEHLRQGIPQRIDRTVMRTLGGTIQKQLLYALRYLGLTSESGVPQETLRRLVSAEGTERQQVWREILATAYPFLCGQDALGFDLSAATPGQLRERFQALSIQGDTVRKAEAFFLGAAEMAGMATSPHIPKRIYKPRRAVGQLTRSRNGRKIRARSDATDASQLPLTVDTSAPPVYQGQVPMPPQAETRQALLHALVTKMPEFDPNWQPEAQAKWLETFDRVAERLLTVTQDIGGTSKKEAPEERKKN
jgi:hypothetical protein